MPNRRRNLPPPVRAPHARRLEDIVVRLDDNGRVYDEALLRDIYDFSKEAHTGQRRRSGEPYFTHPLNVAYLLADQRFDYVCAAVGLLHDVLEDTLSTREELAERFGEEVAELVDGVTKIGQHEYVRRDEAQAETFRKLILASAKDVRVVLVKLADRLHNMQTLQHMPPEKRRRISRETLEIYAPIAHRLGMSRVRGDLEDLAFFYLWPLQYSELYTALAQKMKVGQRTINAIRDRMVQVLDEAGIEAEISFRVKRYYSIYQKLRRQGIDIDQLYDYLAFRIVTPQVSECYAALGIVHQAWRPVPGRFKDYIAMPKPNLYQSLHTTVVGERGQPFEVQIRTYDMDLVAEEGIAAHWQYKTGGGDSNRPWQGDPNILWLRQLLEWQQEVEDARTFLTTLKIDLYPDEVYVFTPKGEVMSFPRGTTPVDFAYKVHTEVGHHCAGARVNGRLVPLRTELSNGDMVEILTNPNRNPSRDWLSFVATARAKSKIRQWLNTEQKKRSEEIGRRLFEKEARKYGVNPKKVLEGKAADELLEAEGLSSGDELMSRIGFGKASPRSILERLVPADQLVEDNGKKSVLEKAVNKILPFTGTGPLVVKGQDDLLAYLAKCCSPVPGEEIVGYVTRGRGVSVHSMDCPNVRNLLHHPERRIDVKWGRSKDKKETYPISIGLETEDRPGILAHLTEAIASQDSNISHIEAQTGTGRARIQVSLQVKDRKHLERILGSLRAVPGVLNVDRRMAGANLEGA